MFYCQTYTYSSKKKKKMKPAQLLFSTARALTNDEYVRHKKRHDQISFL